MEYEFDIKCNSLKPEDFNEGLNKYSLPIIDSFARYSISDISIFRDQFALKCVRKNINRLLTIIFRKYEVFHPIKLKKYLA